jgi:hypothetical protein
MKSFVKVMNKRVKCFEHMREKFPELIEAQLNDGAFIGQIIREIINDDLHEHLLTETEKYA